MVSVPIKKGRTVVKLDDQPVVSVPVRNRDRRHSDPGSLEVPAKVEPTVKVVLRLHLDRQRKKRLFGKERSGPLI